MPPFRWKMALGLYSPDLKRFICLINRGVSWHCGHWWTLLTASFLHGSLLHIFFNLSWPSSARNHHHCSARPSRFAFTYLVTGVGGASRFQPWSGVPTIGVSCSLFGANGLRADFCFDKARGNRAGQLNRQVWAWAIVGFVFRSDCSDGQQCWAHWWLHQRLFLLGYAFPNKKACIKVVG